MILVFFIFSPFDNNSFNIKIFCLKEFLILSYVRVFADSKSGKSCGSGVIVKHSNYSKQPKRLFVATCFHVLFDEVDKKKIEETNPKSISIQLENGQFIKWKSLFLSKAYLKSQSQKNDVALFEIDLSNETSISKQDLFNRALPMSDVPQLLGSKFSVYGVSKAGSCCANCTVNAVLKPSGIYQFLEMPPIIRWKGFFIYVQYLYKSKTLSFFLFCYDNTYIMYIRKIT
jgi:hypothetical protein